MLYQLVFGTICGNGGNGGLFIGVNCPTFNIIYIHLNINIYYQLVPYNPHHFQYLFDVIVFYIF